MALVNPYCSLLSVQKELGNSDADLEDWLEDCINAASRWIDDYCLRDFIMHDHSVTPFTVPEKDAVADYLFLKWPIVTLTQITSGSNTDVIDSSLYTFEVGTRSIQMRDGSNWIAKSTGKKRMGSYSTGWIITNVGLAVPIKLTGTFGYTTPPSAVATACTRIACAWSHEKRRERMGSDGARVSLLDERVPDDAMLLLKRFKRLVN